jgi:probable F420-dependent oxidoreductase
MKIGVAIFPSDTTMQPADLGRAAEERGFESLWFPEHSHIPVSRATPWGGREGAPPLPDYYWRSHDQFVALGAVAAVTSRIKLATGITLIAQRDPIWTAKQAATLDFLSEGRLIMGVGYGWNKEEMRHHGTAYTQRRAILRENVLAMRALWTDDEAEFHGEHVDFEPSWAWPKPKQVGGPPIVLGGAAGPKTAADIAEFADGWMPIGARHTMEGGWSEIVKACETIDRDPATIERTIFFAKPTREELDSLEAAGVGRAVLGLPQGDASEVMAAIDEFANLL